MKKKYRRFINRHSEMKENYKNITFKIHVVYLCTRSRGYNFSFCCFNRYTCNRLHLNNNSLQVFGFDPQIMFIKRVRTNTNIQKAIPNTYGKEIQEKTPYIIK